MKIKKGDWVVVTCQELAVGPEVGTVGRVVTLTTFDGSPWAGVDFGIEGGHDLNGKLDTPTGWWVGINSIKPDKKGQLKRYFQ